MTLLGLLAIIAGLLISRAKFNNNIAMMLPEHSEAARSFQFISDAGLANKVIINLKITDQQHGVTDLTRYIDRLVVKLHSPLIKKIDYRLAARSPLDELNSLTPLFPQLIGAEGLKKLAATTQPAVADKLTRHIFRIVTSPLGTGQINLYRNDPLLLKRSILLHLKEFKQIWGYRFAPTENYFIAPDRRQAMLLLDTTISGTDGKGAHQLLALLDLVLATHPDWLQPTIIAAHRHTVSNEQIIKGDIRTTLIISFIGFFILFALFFRYDPRCLLLLFIPLLATLYMLSLMTLSKSPLSLFVVGLGGVIIGIAVDYGIHIYAAMAGRSPVRGTISVVKPLLAGALTTCGVFIVFTFSGTPGYRQLGIFASGAIMLCLILAITILPFILPQRPFPTATARLLTAINRFVLHHPALFAGSWLLCFLLACLFFIRIQFNSNLSQLDGSTPAIKTTEQQFRTAWGVKSRPAILAVTGDNRQTTQRRTEELIAHLRTNIAGEKFFAATDIWPDAATRQKNLQRWRQFLRSGKLTTAETQLRRAAVKCGFKPELFNPFFRQLREGIQQPDRQQLPEMFQLLLQRATTTVNGKAVNFIFFPDNSVSVKQARTIAATYPGTVIISRNAFRQMLFETVTSRVITLAWWAIAAVIIITLLVFRRVFLTLLALLPVISAIIGAGALFVLLHIPVNAAVCIGAIVVVGLAVDYGIFMVSNLQKGSSHQVLAAIVLSALTTLVGAGAVIFAHHPMLHSVGLVLCAGISIAAITAITAVPAWWRLKKRQHQ